MTQKFKVIPFLFMLSVLMIVGGATAALTPDAGEGASSSVTKTNVLSQANSETTVTEATNVALPRETSAPQVAQIQKNPWHNYPNACETFTVVEGTKQVKNKRGERVWPSRHRRNRYKRKRSDTQRTRDLVKMVVKEMGGDEDAQRIVSMIAMHESSWNPEAIHILNPDREANQKAWQRHSYSEVTERRIQMKMDAASSKTNSEGYYGLKARLSDIRLYKGNPHWDDQLQYAYKIPPREYRGEQFPESEWNESRSVWAFGYGLYGMNAVLFTHIWDKEAPPWILCGDEGIQATVTAVWALRRIQNECDGLSKQNSDRWGSEGGTARGVVRRFARGKCSDKRLGKAWRKLMDGLGKGENGIDWDGHVDFGTKFTRYERHMRGGKWRWTKDKVTKKRIRSDRMAILTHMREKAAKPRPGRPDGLLRATPLERKNPDSAPVIKSRNRTVAVANN